MKKPLYPVGIIIRGKERECAIINNNQIFQPLCCISPLMLIDNKIAAMLVLNRYFMVVEFKSISKIANVL